MERDNTQHWCRHYTGTHNEKCKLGFMYTDFNNGDSFGIIHKMPCLIRNKDKVPPCEHFALLTQDEIKEAEAKGWHAFMEYLTSTNTRRL